MGMMCYEGRLVWSRMLLVIPIFFGMLILMSIHRKTALTLSIVIPAYNEEDQLYECLTAIEQQTEPPEEVIVVDNNSVDRTARIARHFAFVTLVREPRQGLRFSRNTGLNAATGQLLGRIDADTQIDPDWCARARRSFENDGQLMGLTGPVCYHDMPLPALGLWGDRGIRNFLFTLNRSPLLYGSNMVLRREAWHAVLPMLCKNGEFFEDTDMTIHLRRLHFKLAFCPDLVAGVSARRMDDGWSDFRENMRQFDATFARHGERSAAAIGAKFVYLALYLSFKPLRYVFDPFNRQFMLPKNKFLAKPRPTSNT
jgi:glycosyltransferase involved in cell wall biosynthesis